MALAQNAPQISRLPNMDGGNYEGGRGRPGSALARGVQISQMDEARINPQPVSLEESEYLLEQYLSPSKLTNDSAIATPGPQAEMLSERLLAGVDDLNDVTSLEMKVDTTETSLGNFGSLLPNLKQLKLSDSIVNGIRDIGSSLRSLRVLWLCRCGLGDLDGVASLPSLRELYLSYNEISDISPISMIDTLEILDLEGNYIDDVSQIQYLALCQSLKSLSLEGNPVCLMPHPESKQTGYNYREHVRKVLPNLHMLDEEPLGDGAATSRKPNAFEDDWAYLEELQQDALLLESLVDTVNIGTESGSRPGTAALRPATAFRPGTSLRRPPTAFRPQSGRPNSGPTPRPSSARPSTLVRPTTSSVRPGSSEDNNDVDATSDLTMGNVICGLPSRALKNRRKIRSAEEELEKGKQRLMAESGREMVLPSPKTSGEVKNESDLDPAFRDEMVEWRQHHDRRMEEIEKERAPQVLVVDHNESADSSVSDDDDDVELDVDEEEGQSFFVQARGRVSASESNQSHELSKLSMLRLKHDESFEAEDDDEPVRAHHHRRSPSPSLRLQTMRSQSPIPAIMMANGRQLPTPPSAGRIRARMTETDIITTATGLPPPVIRTASIPEGSPSPPSTSGKRSPALAPQAARIRRQLPQVPSLPSKPPVPKS